MPFIDWAKALAIVAVLIAHTGSFHVADTADYLIRFLGSLFHVPVFLMVSGYLHESNAPLKPAKLWRRLRRVLGPYVVASVVMTALGTAPQATWPALAWNLALGETLGDYYYVAVWCTCVCTGLAWSRLRGERLLVALAIVLLATEWRVWHPTFNYFWAIRDPLLQGWLLCYLGGWCARRFDWLALPSRFPMASVLFAVGERAVDGARPRGRQRAAALLGECPSRSRRHRAHRARAGPMAQPRNSMDLPHPRPDLGGRHCAHAGVADRAEDGAQRDRHPRHLRRRDRSRSSTAAPVPAGQRDWAQRERGSGHHSHRSGSRALLGWLPTGRSLRDGIASAARVSARGVHAPAFVRLGSVADRSSAVAQSALLPHGVCGSGMQSDPARANFRRDCTAVGGRMLERSLVGARIEFVHRGDREAGHGVRCPSPIAPSAHAHALRNPDPARRRALTAFTRHGTGTEVLQRTPSTRKRRGGMPDVEVAHGETIVDAGEEIWNWSSPAGKLRLSRRVELFAASIGIGLGLSRKKVLELGCGTGLYTEQLAPLCGELVAADISQTLLDEARTKVPSSHVTFVRQNLEDIQPHELGDGFDAVFGCSVLHHLDLEQTLPQLKMILAPGAELAFSEPNLLNPQVRLMFSRLKWARKKWATSDTEMAFYPWELRSIFTRHGFELIQLYPFDFMHPAIPEGVLDLARRVEHTLEKNPLTRHLAGSYFIHARYPSRSSAH